MKTKKRLLAMKRELAVKEILLEPERMRLRQIDNLLHLPVRKPLTPEQEARQMQLAAEILWGEE